MTEESARERPVNRRGFLKYALGFSFVATLAGVLTPIIGYLWPPARGAEAESGRTLVGTVKDFPVGTGTVVPVGNKADHVAAQRDRRHRRQQPREGSAGLLGHLHPSGVHRIAQGPGPGLHPVSLPRWPF